MPRSATIEDTERALRLALERGDFDSVLEGLMRLYGRALYRYCRRVLGDVSEVDDAHQETFIQAFHGLPRFAGRASFKVWLFRIALRRCLDALRRRRREAGRIEPCDLQARADLPAAPQRSAEDASVSRSVLEVCLAGLLPTVRAVVHLRIVEGLSYAELATVCGKQPGALQMCVARALRALRRCLEATGGGQA